MTLVAMRAVWIKEYGGPEVLRLGEAPDPEPGPGEVLIRVEAAAITFVETQVRAGRAPFPGPKPPMIPGNGVGGVVEAVGIGVDQRLLGQRVVTSTGGQGGYAELAVVADGDVVEVPPSLSLIDATALLADGRTATALARLEPPRSGEWTLVLAAGGGVGSLLVQIAARAGARVVGAASSAAKRALAMELGAELTVDYTAPGWAPRLRETVGDDLRLVFDGVGGSVGREAFELVGPDGRYVISGAASGSFVDTSAVPGRPAPVISTLRDVARLGLSNTELTSLALRAAVAGELRPVIGQTFALADAAKAHAPIQARTTVGKTVLLV